MRFLFGYIFCCLSSFGVCAQTSQLDSLKTLLEGKKGDDRFDILNEMVKKIQRRNIPIAIFCADEAMRILPDLSDSFRIARAYQMKCFVLYSVNKEDEILPYLLKGLAISRKIKNDAIIGYFTNLYGIICIPRGEYGKALAYLLESVRLKGPNSEGLGIVYNNIGLIYYKMKNNRKAIDYYEKALINSPPDFDGLGLLLINIGLAYGQLKEYSQAFAYITRGLESCHSNCNEVRTGGSFALGFVKYGMGNVVESELYSKHSLSLSRNTPDPRFILDNLVRLAQIYVDTKRFNLAHQALKEAEENSIRYNLNELLLNTYEIFISLYHEQKNLPELSNYYLKYNDLREKLHGRELRQQISVFEVDMEHETNLKTIAHQKQVLALQDDSLLLQQRIYYGISALIFLLAIILLLLWRRNLQRKKNKELLTKRIIQRTEYLESKKQFIQGCNNALIKFVATQQCEILRLTSNIKNINPDTCFYDSYNQEMKSIANYKIFQLLFTYLLRVMLSLRLIVRVK